MNYWTALNDVSLTNPVEQSSLLLIEAGHGPHTENPVLLLHKEDHTENKSRDSQPASSLVHCCLAMSNNIPPWDTSSIVMLQWSGHPGYNMFPRVILFYLQNHFGHGYCMWPKSHDNSGSIMTVVWSGWPGFDSWQGWDFSLVNNA
jgi:hypothetical protein